MNYLNRVFEMPGDYSHDYYLSFQGDLQFGHEQFKLAPTWKQLADASIIFCKQHGICISHLVDVGVIRNGIDGQPYYFPADVKVYIVESTLTHRSPSDERSVATES